MLTFRDHGIAPVLAGVRSRGPGRPPSTYTRLDRDYDQLRNDLRVLLRDLPPETAD